MSRTDYKPSASDRARLAGYAATENPRSALAAAVRKLNAALRQLPPERQREIQPDWNASWDELERQREQAADDGDLLVLIADWLRHWEQRLAKPSKPSPPT